MPPAVWRMIAPRPRPNIPITVRNSAAPITARATPGSEKAIWRWRPERIACPAKNTTSTAGQGDRERDGREHGDLRPQHR